MASGKARIYRIVWTSRVLIVLSSLGVQKTTAWLRAFLEFAKLNKHAGTWGRGLNSINNVHVKDVASAIFTVLTAALEHRADEGAQGLCMAFLRISQHHADTPQM